MNDAVKAALNAMAEEFVLGAFKGMLSEARLRKDYAPIVRELLDNAILVARPSLTEEQVGKVREALSTLTAIGEGSQTANSLPHVAKIARAALALLEGK